MTTSGSRGLTLLETLVWAGMFAAAMIAVSSTLIMFYKSNRYTIEQAQAISSAQKGVDRMTREIREAAYSSQGAYPVVSIGANDIVFYADVDTDAFIERVHYYISGTTLMRAVANPTGDPAQYTTAEVASPIADFVQNVSMATNLFRYYDVNGTEVTNYTQWANVRFIKATVVVNIDPRTAPNQLVLTSSATMRNLY